MMTIKDLLIKATYRDSPKFKGEIIMDITGILTIGNNEKCPFCDLIITEEIDSFIHMTESHKKDLNNVLFGDQNRNG